MGLVRFVGRTVTSLVGLGILGVTLAALLFIGIPALIALTVGLVGLAIVFSVGLPVFIVGLILIIGLGALISATLGLIGFAVLIAKIALAVMIVSWLFRKLFGGRPSEPALVGPPVRDVPLKDRYQVEAERELDRDLGL
jgi:hypothetical protein